MAQQSEGKGNLDGISMKTLQRNGQWICNTQNDLETAVKGIEIETKIKMLITVYLSEGNVNSIGSRSITFGCNGT